LVVRDTFEEQAAWISKLVICRLIRSVRHVKDKVDDEHLIGVKIGDHLYHNIALPHIIANPIMPLLFVTQLQQAGKGHLHRISGSSVAD